MIVNTSCSCCVDGIDKIYLCGKNRSIYFIFKTAAKAQRAFQNRGSELQQAHEVPTAEALQEDILNRTHKFNWTPKNSSWCIELGIIEGLTCYKQEFERSIQVPTIYIDPNQLSRHDNTLTTKLQALTLFDK